MVIAGKSGRIEHIEMLRNHLDFDASIRPDEEDQNPTCFYLMQSVLARKRLLSEDYNRDVKWKGKCKSIRLNRRKFFNEGIQLSSLSLIHRSELYAQLPHLERTERNVIIDMDVRNFFAGDAF